MDVNGIWYGNYPLVSNPLVSLVVGKEMNSTFPKGHPKSCGTSWNIFFFRRLRDGRGQLATGQFATKSGEQTNVMVESSLIKTSEIRKAGLGLKWGERMINQWRNGVLCDTQNDEQQEQPVLLATSESVVHGSPRFFVFHAFSFSFTVVYSTYCTILASQHTYPVGNGKSPSIYPEPANTANKL